MHGFPSAEPKRICLLVLGMRSGTSAFAQCLSKLGAGLPANLLPGNHSNETGHFEPRRIVDFNDEFLGKLGTKWDTLRDPDLTQLPVEELAEDGIKLRDLIAAEYGTAPLIVLKEPRIGRLMPFYVEALEACGHDVRVVLMRRHPVAVARSFVERDDDGLGYALLLWISYVLSVEFSTRGLRRTFVSYDDLMANPEHALSAVMPSLGMSLPPAEAIDAARNTIRQDLRHQHPDDEPVPAFVSDADGALDVLTRDDLSPWAMQTLDRQRKFVAHLVDRFENRITTKMSTTELFELCGAAAASDKLVEA